MNKFCIFFVSLFLLSISLSAQDLYKVTADKLNVRETKDPSSKKVGHIPQNENVQVLDSSDAKFFKIKVTNGEGWVSKDYLTRVSPVVPKVIAPAAKPTVKKETKGYADTIFFSLTALVFVGVLFLIFKFFKRHPFLGSFAAIVVLGIAYLCYATFIKAKVVNGLFTSNSDTQYQTFEFKNDSVTVKDSYSDSLFTVPYQVEGDMIKFKEQENTFLLMIRDNETLIGEGFTKGVFNKN